MSALPPPPKIAVPEKPTPADRGPWKNNGGNRGGGHPAGQSPEPIRAPTEVVIDASVDLILGAKKGDVAKKHNLEPCEVRRIETLTNLTPQAFFDKLSGRFESLLEITAARLQEKIEAGEGSVKDLAIALGIVNEKLLQNRGVARPTTLNQTININGISAAEARQFLLTGEAPKTEPT